MPDLDTKGSQAMNGWLVTGGWGGLKRQKMTEKRGKVNLGVTVLTCHSLATAPL